MLSFLQFKTPYQGITFGLALHVLANILGPILDSDLVLAVIGLIGWLFMSFYALKINYIYNVFNNGIVGFLMKIYFLLLIFMIIRGYIIDYPFPWNNKFISLLNFHFLSPKYILQYFVPLFMLIGINQIEFKSLLKISNIFIFLFFFLFILNTNTIFNYSETILELDFIGEEKSITTKIAGIFTSFGFFLLCKEYLAPKKWYFILICWFLSTLIFAITARRGALATNLLLGFFTAVLYVNTGNIKQKIFSYLSVIILISIIILTYFNFENQLFKYLQIRGYEDTRSDVNIAFLSQANEIELWFGKGLNGRYYLPIEKDSVHDGWRYGVETGFYNLVLKGGYTFAVIYILILLIPSFKGIFKSKNTLTKALGLYILLSLIELYPFGWLYFNLKFFIIWVGVVLCNNHNIRNMTNNEVKQRFFK